MKKSPLSSSIFIFLLHTYHLSNYYAMVFGNIFGRFFNKRNNPSSVVAFRHTNINTIQTAHHVIFTEYQKNNYKKQIIDIFNEHGHISDTEMSIFADVDVLLIYGTYHRIVTKNDAEIRKTYSRLMELKCEQAYLIFSKYLLDKKRNEVESENVLQLAITNMDSKNAKYQLACHHLIDRIRTESGLALLDELALVGYFPAIYDIIYYYNEYDEKPSKNVKKYIWLPYEIDEAVFENNVKFARQMETINYIMHRHCSMHVIYKHLTALANPNKYARMALNEDFTGNKTKSSSCGSSFSLCSDESDASK